MPNRHPFRQMRETLRTTQAQVALLLATEGVVAWAQKDYALLFIMNNMVKQFENPTYTQYIGALGAYLRFEKRLIDQLPEGELKTSSGAEWAKISAGYEELLEVQPSKQ
jgi:hypothetical protein